MEKDVKRPAVLGDSYDNEPFIENCRWIEKPTKERRNSNQWTFGKVITQTP